jgi:hypothetical protein
VCDSLHSRWYGKPSSKRALVRDEWSSSGRNINKKCRESKKEVITLTNLKLSLVQIAIMIPFASGAPSLSIGHTMEKIDYLLAQIDPRSLGTVSWRQTVPRC